MGDAQRGDDAIAFFAAHLGSTRRLQASSTTPVQLLDDDGPLRPVRHLIHIANLNKPGESVWIKMGKFEKGATLGVTTAPPDFPMNPATIFAIEVNVRKGENDQIAVIISGNGASANVYITEISRRA